MNDVSLFVQHDVAIMPVFNLEQKKEKTIRSHTADEIIASLYKKSKQIRTHNLITHSSQKQIKLNVNFPPLMISLNHD